MKRRETVFFKALSDIPQSYIDELTQWQTARAAPSLLADSPERKSDGLHRREEKTAVKQNSYKNREADISVQSLKPVTAGIMTALAACAVVAVGFGSGIFSQHDSGMDAAYSQESTADLSEAVEEVTELPALPWETAGSDVVVMPEDALPFTLADDGSRLDADDDETVTVFSCIGMETDFPDIASDSGILYTSMDDLKPVLEGVPTSDMQVKGVKHAEPVFAQGRYVLFLKVQNNLHDWNPHLRGLSVTADHVIHADVQSYVNLNDTESLRCPEECSYYYMLISVPSTLAADSTVSVIHSVYYSEYSGDGEYDPLLDDYTLHLSDPPLKHLPKNDADYVFPYLTQELYSEQETDSKPGYLLSNMLGGESAAQVPAELLEKAEGLTAGKPAFITVLQVPTEVQEHVYIVEQSMIDERELILPEKGYTAEYLNSVADPQLRSGTRMTILYSDQISGHAKLAYGIDTETYTQCDVDIINNPPA